MRITSVRGNTTYEISFKTYQGTSKLGTSTTITDARILRNSGKWFLLGIGDSAKHPKDQPNEYVGAKTAFRRVLNSLKKRGDIDKEETDFLWFLFFTMWGRPEVSIFQAYLPNNEQVSA